MSGVGFGVTVGVGGGGVGGVDVGGIDVGDVVGGDVAGVSGGDDVPFV